ncbi:MAG: hypothetical protein QM644_10520 [Mobilitalea sp.]
MIEIQDQTKATCYDDLDSKFIETTIFPYFITASNKVMSISPSFDYAILYLPKDIHHLFLDIYNQIFRASSALAKNREDLMDFWTVLLKFIDKSYNSIGKEHCLRLLEKLCQDILNTSYQATMVNSDIVKGSPNLTVSATNETSVFFVFFLSKRSLSFGFLRKERIIFHLQFYDYISVYLTKLTSSL